MQVSISSKTTPPRTNPRDTTWREQKPSLPPGQSLCTKPSPRDRTGSQKPHPRGHKVREFHKYIYELRHYLKALWTQQIKGFFNEATVYQSVDHLVVTRVKLLNVQKLYMICTMYVNNLLRKRGLKLCKKYFEFLLIPTKFFFHS